MANTAIQQQRLADSPHFHERVKSAFSSVAFQVILEGRDTPVEVQRYDFARNVLADLDARTDATVGWLVQRTNLNGANTTYNYDIPAVVTDATDAAIESQLMTDWNVMAGVIF